MTVKNLFVLINVLYKFWLVFDEFYYKLPTTSFLTISEGILFQKLILWSPNLDHLLLRYLLFVCIGIHAMIRVLQHAHKFSIFNFQITPCPTQNLQKYYSALRNLILDTFYQLKPIIFFTTRPLMCGREIFNLYAKLEIHASENSYKNILNQLSPAETWNSK